MSSRSPLEGAVLSTPCLCRDLLDDVPAGMPPSLPTRCGRREPRQPTAAVTPLAAAPGSTARLRAIPSSPPGSRARPPPTPERPAPLSPSGSWPTLPSDRGSGHRISFPSGSLSYVPHNLPEGRPAARPSLRRATRGLGSRAPLPSGSIRAVVGQKPQRKGDSTMTSNDHHDHPLRQRRQGPGGPPDPRQGHRQEDLRPDRRRHGREDHHPSRARAEDVLARRQLHRSRDRRGEGPLEVLRGLERVLRREPGPPGRSPPPHGLLPRALLREGRGAEDLRELRHPASPGSAPEAGARGGVAPRRFPRSVGAAPSGAAPFPCPLLLSPSPPHSAGASAPALRASSSSVLKVSRLSPSTATALFGRSPRFRRGSGSPLQSPAAIPLRSLTQKHSLSAGDRVLFRSACRRPSRVFQARRPRQRESVARPARAARQPFGQRFALALAARASRPRASALDGDDEPGDRRCTLDTPS